MNYAHHQSSRSRRGGGTGSASSGPTPPPPQQFQSDGMSSAVETAEHTKPVPLINNDQDPTSVKDSIILKMRASLKMSKNVLTIIWLKLWLRLTRYHL